MNFFTHIIRVALALGLVLGLLLFSVLLYVSDFGARRPPESHHEQVRVAQAPVAAPSKPDQAVSSEHAALYWLFGPPVPPAAP